MNRTSLGSALGSAIALIFLSAAGCGGDQTSTDDGIGSVGETSADTGVTQGNDSNDSNDTANDETPTGDGDGDER